MFLIDVFFSQNSFIYSVISLGWMITFIPLLFFFYTKIVFCRIDPLPLVVVLYVVEIYVFSYDAYIHSVLPCRIFLVYHYYCVCIPRDGCSIGFAY